MSSTALEQNALTPYFPDDIVSKQEGRLLHKQLLTALRVLSPITRGLILGASSDPSCMHIV